MTIDGYSPNETVPRQLEVADGGFRDGKRWVVVTIITAGTPYQAVRVPVKGLRDAISVLDANPHK
jgi:hypothetical protein